ncbi:hypothetical protein POH93_21020 [Phytobacter diazotrophicus]|uniref:hypothetical protein n=1 Tax=Phytobacter diazotrophicus TaxID=395631 RepID=UPI001D1E6912|nr:MULTISPECIES: hypothetical protein [Phytobacter]MBV8874939.1 hypothetical protein [Phytobacter sp.]MDC0727855.1 hypothetical protein [Phytobacter diazotrophicus]MDC0735129.1 hypothetical protein [Phytobacter diazotrophicus]
MILYSEFLTIGKQITGIDMRSKTERDQRDKTEIKALSGKASNRDSRHAATAQKAITAIHHCG